MRQGWWPRWDAQSWIEPRRLGRPAALRRHAGNRRAAGLPAAGLPCGRLPRRLNQSTRELSAVHAAELSASNSAAVSSIAAAAVLESRWSTLEVPGIGSMTG